MVQGGCGVEYHSDECGEVRALCPTDISLKGECKTEIPSKAGDFLLFIQVVFQIQSQYLNTRYNPSVLPDAYGTDSSPKNKGTDTYAPVGNAYSALRLFIGLATAALIA